MMPLLAAALATPTHSEPARAAILALGVYAAAGWIPALLSYLLHRKLKTQARRGSRPAPPTPAYARVSHIPPASDLDSPAVPAGEDDIADQWYSMRPSDRLTPGGR